MIYNQKKAEDYIRQHARSISGDLCIFGNYLQKPGDYDLRFLSCEIKEDYLKLYFDEHITLEIWNWQGLTANDRNFTIKHASRIRYQSPSYQSLNLSKNSNFIEFIVKNGIIEVLSNSRHASLFTPSLAKPAILIITSSDY